MSNLNTFGSDAAAQPANAVSVVNRPEQVPKYAGDRPMENKALLNSKAEQQQRAAQIANG